MSIFINPRKFFGKYSILVLGSYYPEYKAQLEDLIEFLRNEGFENTKLAEELIEFPENLQSDERKIYLISKIEKEMEKSDFNVFVLFPKKNDSVIAELMLLIHKEYYREKKGGVILFTPSDYSHIIVEGLIIRDGINHFSYSNDIEMKQKCLVFIKTNLFKVFD